MGHKTHGGISPYEMFRDGLGIGVWACVGVVIRYWLEDMARFTGFPGFTDLWANLVGTMIMGMAEGHKSFSINKKDFVGFTDLWANLVGTMIMEMAQGHKNFLSFSPPTAVGITTGLCGSITTFSSWQVENAQVLVDWKNIYSNWQNVLISFTNQVIGITACLSMLIFGRHLSNLSPAENHKVKEGCEEKKAARIEFAIYLVVLVVTVTVVLSLGFTIEADRLGLLFSIFFAPFGAVIRWLVGKWLNNPELTREKYYIPYGTLLVNIIGALLLGMIKIVIQENDCWLDPTDGNGPLKAAIAAGHGTGFCGCLTTVSTWIVELSTLPTKKAYIYGLISVLIAQGLLIALLGTYRWTQNPWDPC